MPTLLPPVGHNGGPTLDAVLANQSEREYWFSYICEDPAAEFSGVSPRTLQGWRYRGGGPRYYRLSAKMVRYRRVDLFEHAEKCARTSTSDDKEGAKDAAPRPPAMMRRVKKIRPRTSTNDDGEGEDDAAA